MNPRWNKLAKLMKGNVKIGRIDGEQNSDIAKRFEIESYPTIILFPMGPKTHDNYEIYHGTTTTSEMAEWLNL